MERLVRGISGAVIRWVELRLTPADQRGSVARGQIWEQIEGADSGEGSSRQKEMLLAPTFFPPRIGADPAEAALLSSLMADSIARFRRGLGGDTKQH